MDSKIKELQEKIEVLKKEMHLMENKINMEEKISNHPFVKELQNLSKGKYGEFRLVGGAVIDIIDGRVPKDYDITSGSLKTFLDAGAMYMTETSNATTLEFKGQKVQLLKTIISDFDFKVSQSSVRFMGDNMYFGLEELDIKNKILRPVNYTDKKNILNSLSRIPHWRKKGYDIDDSSYYSLLNGLDTKTVNYYPFSS